MTGLADPLSIVLWIVAALWLVFSAGRMLDLRVVRPLDPGTPPVAGPIPTPRVSVVIAARNEEARIERAVRHVFEQTGVDLQVVVVDDRSTDRTFEILEHLTAETPALKVLRVEDLPPGWLGKPHACHLGGQRASGEWLLFTDADAWMKRPDLISRALHAAARERADHVCLFPGESRTTLWGKAAVLNFSMGLLFFAGRANRDRRGASVGVGAFNLIRAKAYRAIGGHEPLRLEVIDDLKLGLLLVRAGYRSRAFGAVHDMEVHWAGSLRGLIRALEKNYFALLDFSTAKGLLAVAGMLGLHLGALLGPLSGRPAGIAAGLGLATVVLPAWRMARRSGWTPLPAFLAPLLGFVLPLALLYSMIRVLRRGGVTWRETFYPLETLRRGRIPL